MPSYTSQAPSSGCDECRFSLGINAAKPKEKPYKLSDGGGLFLLIEPRGSKVWRFRYQFGGKEKRLSLGIFPAVLLADARNRRDKAKEALAEGLDPSHKRRQEKFAAAIAAGNTFGRRRLPEKLKKEGVAASTLEKNAWLLQNLAGALTPRPIAEISSAEVLEVLRRVEKTGRRESAHRLRGVIGTVYRFAIFKATVDPTAALKGALLKINVKHRAAITDEKKLGAPMLAMDEYDGWTTLRAALLLLALTMVRPGEIRQMRKSDIVFPKALWRVPAVIMKMKQPHDVPLSKQALEVIEGVWDLTPGNGLLMPSVRSFVKPLSEGALNSALRRMGYSKDEVTAHGFRSSASTILNERGFDNDVIEACLAHQEENDVRRAYNRSTYLRERTVVMQQWADLLDEFRNQALRRERRA